MTFRRNLSNAMRLAIRRSALARPLRRLLRRTPLTDVLARGSRIGWDVVAGELLRDAERSPLSADWLHAGLRADSNLDLELELLLVALRRRLLLEEGVVPGTEAIQETLTTLALQALDNAFVWTVSDEETAAVAALQAGVSELLRGGGVPDWIPVARLCLYRRPDQVFGDIARAREVAARMPIPCDSFRSFLDSYLASRERELALRATVPPFGSLSSVPEAVAELYETHPYPRWVALRESDFIPPRQALRPFFPDSELTFLDRPFRLLIAGCGTGYEIVHAARAFPKAEITAVDLSRASLGYASLMLEKFGVRNVRLLRMDLHELPRLGETFEMVRCIGVLHHLPSPREGGAAVVRATASGGILHFSLYSTLARRELARLRRAYGFSPALTDDAVRRLRYRVLTEEPETVEERLPLRADFFDLDRCRDLLCHPLEHTFTVPQLAELVSALGLDFRGLLMPSIVRSQYWTRFPAPGDRRDWGAWQRFEERHPDAFGSLYQLWLRKP